MFIYIIVYLVFGLIFQHSFVKKTKVNDKSLVEDTDSIFFMRVCATLFWIPIIVWYFGFIVSDYEY